MPTHQDKLKIANDVILPKFHCREKLKANLINETDPLIADEIQFKMLSLRNDIFRDVAEGLRDMLSARASGWRNSLRDDVSQTARTPKWYAALKPDAIMSYIHENLLEAVERYDPYKKPFCKFTSFFWTHNENMLKNRYKKLHVDKSDVSKSYSLDVIDSDFVKDKGNREEDHSYKPYHDSRCFSGHRRLHPNLMESEKVIEDQLNHNMILREILKRTISRKEKHIIKRLLLGYSQSEIADKLGYSGTNISTTIRNIALRCEDLVEY